MNILFLVPYPVKESPSQRFRFEQYFKILTSQGYSFTVQSFLNSQNWRLFFKPGNWLLKIRALLNGFYNRFSILLSLARYDFIFIHREVFPLGPPVLEWLIAKVFRKKIIYDFDDAIWHTDRQRESLLMKFVKWRSKVANICRWSYRISCGNDYLCLYARNFNKDVVLNPTTIDTEALHNPHEYLRNPLVENKIIIGWTGSHSTLKYLREIEPVLQKIEEQFPFVTIRVIADREPDLRLKSLIFKPWSIETEIEDLATFDIGIMPLPDDEWSKGKCGFKALQYMALEIPTIASTVGVNSAIIEHEINGYLAASLTDWENYLKLLITNHELRRAVGKRGRRKVMSDYSVESNAENFLSLFA